jgi:hypothetical protein
MAIKMNGAYFNGHDGSGVQTALMNIPGSVTTDYFLFSLNVASSTSADINYGWKLNCVLATGGQLTAAFDQILSSVVKAGLTQGKCQRIWLTVGAAVNGPSTYTWATASLPFNGFFLCDYSSAIAAGIG